MPFTIRAPTNGKLSISKWKGIGCWEFVWIIESWRTVLINLHFHSPCE
jgi:hypothetical protein